MAENDTAATKETAQQVFRIQRVFLKDVSFESPMSPGIFLDTDWKPQVSVHLNSDHQAMDNDLHEIVLTLTVTVKCGESTAYLAEVKQAGLFTINGFDEQRMGGMLFSFCPNILFPFAREAVASLATKGGFPQLLLDPVNFDALYAQHLQNNRQNAPAPDTAQ